MMKMLRGLGLSLLWAVLSLTLVVPVVRADTGQLKVSSVRATDFPGVTVRFTVSNPRGEPVPVLGSKDFMVTEDGQRVDRVNAFPLYQSPTPLAVVMAIDISGSMNDNGKIAAAKQAARTFIAGLRPVDQVELISFSDQVHTVVPFTHNKSDIVKGIDGLVAKGNTSLYDAAFQSVSDVLRAQGSRVVIVLTDGQDTASRASLTQTLALAKQTQVPIYTIGLGPDADDAVLTRMANETSGHYFKAPKTEDLAPIFQLLSQTIANQYELYYFSSLPQRPGQKVNVGIRVQHQGVPSLTGQFSYTMPPVVQKPVAAPVNPGQLQLVPEPPRPAMPTILLPTNLTEQIAALCAFGSVLAILFGLALRTTKDASEMRLSAFVTGLRQGRQRSQSGSETHLARGLLNFLASIVVRYLPANQMEILRRNMALAGYPYGWGAEQFLGLRVLLAIILGSLGYLAEMPRGPLVMMGAAAVLALLGFLLPAAWLGMRIRSRQRAIFRALPNALDLIAVTVEAGLGFDQAVSEVCQKWQNDLTREFALYLTEVRMGRSRREALYGIVERTGVPELSSFVGAVVQADELGSGIARTLAVQAEQVRIKRRQFSEKLAHEAAIKMIFPMTFLIFPAIFVVILGPAVPSILEAFSHMAKK